ncbi:hypothetical protein I603_1419 [Erythrobacter dokdonensis DSW-74]|uniref:Uncharacterized protein n=1 Tax=Erythrobacter dokdonensis DSW-74 TaxID=1300349 RepID=A0A1A7BH17_9SPHN|nr:hypothetical protein I603_1419 [Erythrobacter dokdonensis DSW-74]
MCVSPDGDSSLQRRAGPTRTTTEQGKRTMRMISEKAIAFLLAVAMSGTAFNTFIV